jgi:hypothetical protein
MEYAPKIIFRLLPNQYLSLGRLAPLMTEELLFFDSLMTEELLFLKIFLMTPKRHIEIGESTPKNVPQRFYIHPQSLGG